MARQYVIGGFFSSTLVNESTAGGREYVVSSAVVQEGPATSAAYILKATTYNAVLTRNNANLVYYTLPIHGAWNNTYVPFADAFSQFDHIVTATAAGSGIAWMQSTDLITPLTSGLYYAEILVINFASGDTILAGISDTAVSKKLQVSSTGNIINETGVIAGPFTWLQYSTYQNVIQIAYRADLNKVWFALSGGVVWNAGGTADPVTGIGGYTFNSTSPACIFATVGKTNSSLSINTGMVPFIYAVPSGSVPWYSAPVAHGGWDRYFDQSSGHQYFGNNDRTSSNLGYFYDIGIDFHTVGSSDLVYAEVHMDAIGGTDVPGIGVTDYVSFNNGCWLGSNGVVANGHTTIGTYPGLTFGSGDTICVAYNAATNQAWFRINNGQWNASGTANPATGVGGFASDAHSGVPVTIAFYGNYSGTNVTLNTGTVAFAYAMPSGFSAWYSTPAGRAKVWNGSVWTQKPAKVWSGSAWQIKPVKVWNGSAWV